LVFFDLGADGKAVFRESDYVGVSINYRLGVMGFMALDAYAKHDRGRSGNYGFMDQILALKVNIHPLAN
jgi:para-nitrobenzyl esterase